METQLAQGILFYSGLYITIILTIVTFLTGRLIFIFFILLTVGLVVYMGYLTTENSDHLKNMGTWIENTIRSIYAKIQP